MELRQLRTVVTIIEAGTIRAAARRLHLAPSAVSQQVKGLESELGCLLFLRTNGGIRPTPAGIELLNGARDVLEAAEALGRRARAAPQAGTNLRVGQVSEGLAYRLHDVLGRMRAQDQTVRVTISSRRAPDIVAGLRCGELDVGIVNHKDVVAGYREVPLYTERLVVLARHDSPWATASHVRLRQMAGEPLVLHPVGHDVRDLLDSAFKRLDIRPSVIFESSSANVLCHAVQDGMGIAIVTENFARVNRWPTLLSVPLLGRQMKRAMTLMYRPDSASETAISVFITSVRQVFTSPGSIGGQVLLH